MELLKELNSDTIVVCSNENKNKILEALYKKRKILDFKIMNLNEFIKKLIFDYDTKAIYHIMEKYNITYENALVYLNNIYFIHELDYENQKLKKLVTIKEYLLNNNLLIIDNLFQDMIKNKKIIFYEIDSNKYIKYITSNLKTLFIKKQYNKYPDKIIYGFETITEEINYVANEISKLIDNGINISNIKIINLFSEYKFPLQNIFNQCGLFIDVHNNSLFSTIIGNFFINNLESDINITISKLKNSFDLLNEETTENINRIINICNKYTWCDDFLKIKECLICELKKTKSYYRKYDNCIEVVDINSVDLSSDDYFFLLGFNQENIPKIYKDDDYIDDSIADEVNKETSKEKNMHERNNIINILLSIKNLTITYKNRTDFGSYYISNLNDYLNFKIENKNDTCLCNYSLLNLKIDYSKKLDTFIKYGIKAPDLDLLYSNIKNINYRTYDNKFKGINNKDLIEYLNNKLLLSYSSIDNFYKCQFSYYVNNILKLNPFKENFSAYIGSLIHYILSIAFKPNFDYDCEFTKYISENKFDMQPKDKFFLSKIKKELQFIIRTIQKQKKLTKFKDELYEQKIYIDKKNDIHITLMGIIDKIMYIEEEGKTYLSIVDYKTGSISTDLKYINYGLQLQLPIYAYLILNGRVFDNPIISGLYYQKLISPEIKATTEDDYLSKKEDNLKLMGFSTNDETILGKFDITYENSELIKSMKITSKGFSSYSKIYSKNELNDIINIADEKINNAIENICNGNFKINPKRIKFDNVACKYCKFKGICFVTENDVELIEEGE